MYFYSYSIQGRFRPQAAHMPVLICMEDAFEACVNQTHTVPVFLVLCYQKVALNGGCSGAYWSTWCGPNDCDSFPLLIPPFRTPRRIDKPSSQQWCWCPHYARIFANWTQQHGDSGHACCASSYDTETGDSNVQHKNDSNGWKYQRPTQKRLKWVKIPTSNKKITQMSENTNALNSARHSLWNSARFGISCWFAEFKVAWLWLIMKS